MATGKTYYQRPIHRFLPTDRSYHVAIDSGFEFDQSDLYSDSPDFRRKLFTSGRNRIKQSGKSSTATVTTTTTVGSLPMNIPDWSKILREENRHSRRRSIENNDDDCLDGGDRFEGRLPPHEYLARTRMASFSVHEGVGRTLKGRDLSKMSADLVRRPFMDSRQTSGSTRGASSSGNHPRFPPSSMPPPSTTQVEDTPLVPAALMHLPVHQSPAIMRIRQLMRQLGRETRLPILHPNRPKGTLRIFVDNEVARDVAKSIKSYFPEPYTSWTLVPEQTKEIWFKSFAQKYH